MLNQKKVNVWLAAFQRAVRCGFPGRVRLIAHHGSWARGEAGPNSDIDTMVVLDRIRAMDLVRYKKIIQAMPDADKYASGLLVSVQELKVWPRRELIQFFYGSKYLYGTLAGIIQPPGDADFLEDARGKAADNLFNARHYLLFPHDHRQVVFRLYYSYKNCFYALQSLVFLKTHKFVLKKNDLLKILKDRDDREVIKVARDWKKMENQLRRNASYYIRLLERWSQKTLLATQAMTTNSHTILP